jgi:hypothetical protein
MRRFALLLGGVLALGLAGCAGYRVGPTNGLAAGEKSVQVNFFQNKTFEPRLVEAVNSALRKNLQKDGTYRLNTKDEGDIIITGEIVRFNRSPLSFQAADIITVRDYTLSLTAKIVATDRTSGKIVLQREVSGKTTIRAGTDLASAERQAVPLLADDLAKNATAMLADGTW